MLTLVRRSPDLGERALTRALAAEGATPGRIHRILERHGLLTAETRRRWVSGTGGTGTKTSTGRPEAQTPAKRRIEAGAEMASAPEAEAGMAAMPALPPALLAAARDLAARLEPYFAGGLARLFAAEDDVDFSAPLVVVHVADAAETDARLGALKMALDGAAVREMLEAERRAGRRYTAIYF